MEKNELPASPFVLFEEWFNEAKANHLIGIPESFCLSTVNKNGCPDSRIVLLKGCRRNEFVFFTNSLSTKGQDLRHNPNVAMNFYWEPLGKQIRIQGMVEKIDNNESDTYFAMRPRGSQIGAWASEQSCHIPSRAYLEKKEADFTLKFEGAEVPRPEHWFGYSVKPSKIEFWLNKDNRLHDRFVFTPQNEEWIPSRVAP